MTAAEERVLRPAPLGATADLTFLPAMACNFSTPISVCLCTENTARPAPQHKEIQHSCPALRLTCVADCAFKYPHWLWWRSSTVRVLAWPVQSPGFDPKHRRNQVWRTLPVIPALSKEMRTHPVIWTTNSFSFKSFLLVSLRSYLPSYHLFSLWVFHGQLGCVFFLDQKHIFAPHPKI